MIETNFIHIITAVLALLGMGVIVGALKGVDWLISQKYQTISKCNECNLALNGKIDSNKAVVTENINKQYREIIEKIERQTAIFQELAKSVSEISAENKIILHNLGLKK